MSEPTDVPAQKKPLLAAYEVVAGYVPGVNILNGTNLELYQDEFVGVIGPNGAGKSTLVKALFGLLPIRGGSVTFDGEDITGLKAHDLVARGIGYVPQTRNVFPRLADRRRQRAGSLSGGERQMLAMGRALMLDPRVLLLDEPSAGLSPAYQDEVFINCRRINDAFVSIVMVEQNAHRCLQICHRGYVLDQGRNAYTNTGDQLLNDPKVIELYLGSLTRATG